MMMMKLPTVFYRALKNQKTSLVYRTKNMK